MFICISVGAPITKKIETYTPTSLQASIRHSDIMTEGSVIIMFASAQTLEIKAWGEEGGGELCQPCYVTAAFSQEKCSRRIDAAEKRT